MNIYRCAECGKVVDLQEGYYIVTEKNTKKKHLICPDCYKRINKEQEDEKTKS